MDPRPPEAAPEAQANPQGLASFDSPIVKAAAPPLVAIVAVVFKMSPFGFLLEGFHVWIHEVGHASVAWLSSRPAVPLPIGWTNVEPGRSMALYGMLLASLCWLGVVGWRERRAWPMILAAALTIAQAFMTWRMSEDRARQWMIFGGVGGEFYLAAAMVCLFYFEFPDWFRWGYCRYLVLFIGAASFTESYTFWKQVKSGAEGIPDGSMINGEDDGGGDMNILKDDYHWTQHQIIYTYNHLADACLLSIAVVYLFFNLRLNHVFNPLLARCFSVGLGEPERSTAAGRSPGAGCSANAGVAGRQLACLPPPFRGTLGPSGRVSGAVPFSSP